MEISFDKVKLEMILSYMYASTNRIHLVVIMEKLGKELLVGEIVSYYQEQQRREELLSRACARLVDKRAWQQ